jgi:tetratricopeptide (TPR) repeat protein
VQHECLELSLDLGLDASVTQATYHLGMLATSRGDRDEAAAYLEESAERWAVAGNRLAAAGALLNLSEVERARGDLQRAASIVDECLAVGRELGAKALVASSCTVKATVLGLRGDRAGARRFFEEAVALHGETGNVSGRIEVAENIAIVSAGSGDAATAVRLVAAGGSERDRIGYPRDPANETEVGRLLADAAASLGASRAATEEALGVRLGLDRAIEDALRGLV